MQQRKEKELLLKYFENKCSAEELQELAYYFANVEYPDSLDELLEKGWKEFKPSEENNEQLADKLLKKFYQRINIKS